MRLEPIVLQCKTQILSLVRIPSSAVPIFIFPPLFYLFWGAPDANSPVEANHRMVSFMVYGMLTVAFYQVSGAIAEDRRQSWEPYLWTLPCFHRTRLLGRLISGFLSATIVTATLAIMAYILTPVESGALDWTYLIAILVVGSIPFVLLAVGIGYLLHPKAVSPVASLVFFSLAYAGALWDAPDSLPAWLQPISSYLPTRQWLEVSWTAVFNHHWQDFHWFGLLFYTIAFGLLAIIGIWRNDVLRRY
jgi:ABC-2 type transport system permease protein